ncbi:MAG: aminotransferase class I/II-fold pyridoxal phosphate-dependent enzyme [Francisellaceae bacterium]
MRLKAHSLSCDEIKRQGLYRQRIALSRQAGFLSDTDGSYLDFISNDYLRLSQHRDVKKAMIKAVETYGVGSGASAIVSGYSVYTQALEQRFAEFVGYPAALFVNSGYHANLAVMSTLLNPDDVILADKHVHASIIDGVSLSGARMKRFSHQHFCQLADLAKRFPEAQYVISEGIFSMEGDITDLKRLRQAMKRKQKLIVDDAHGFGILGRNGRGSVDFASLSVDEVPVFVVPFGKAMGAMGAMICADEVTIDRIVQLARSFLFSTALPPAVVAASISALSVLEKSDEPRQCLFDNIRYFNRRCEDLGLKLSSFDMTPIRSIVIGDNRRLMRLQQNLKEQGFYVAAIRPPTVAENSSRLRISLSCDHRHEDIDRLLKAIKRDDDE